MADERDGLGRAALAAVRAAAGGERGDTDRDGDADRDLLVVLTEFLLGDQEETRPCPVTAGRGLRAGRNSMSDDRTSYPE